MTDEKLNFFFPEKHKNMSNVRKYSLTYKTSFHLKKSDLKSKKIRFPSAAVIKNETKVESKSILRLRSLTHRNATACFPQAVEHNLYSASKKLFHKPLVFNVICTN